MTQPKRMVRPSPELVRQLREEANRVLSPREVADFLQTPVSDEERAQMNELIDWFLRRYPTPAARLAYGRKWTLRLRNALPDAAADPSAQSSTSETSPNGTVE